MTIAARARLGTYEILALVGSHSIPPYALSVLSIRATAW
jgi:hypothetical protein